jgi:adenylate kinase family enzyme
MELRFAAADTIIFLDFPLWTCLWGIFRRWLMYAGRTRPDMTEGCTEKLDWDFILWVINFHLKKKNGINEKLHKYSEGKDIFILRNRKEVNKFIAGVEGEYK